MRTYIVLGTGRSATTFITGCLKNNNVYMGDKFNDHLEVDDFKQLNIDILQAAGGNHWNPPSRAEIMGVKDEFDKRIQETIKKHEREMWGWKDPRTTLTLELYLPHLRGDVYLIYCVRSFSEVVKSLVERQGWVDEETAKNTLKIYRDRLKGLIDIMAEL